MQNKARICRASMAVCICEPQCITMIVNFLRLSIFSDYNFFNLILFITFLPTWYNVFRSHRRFQLCQLKTCPKLKPSNLCSHIYKRIHTGTYGHPGPHDDVSDMSPWETGMLPWAKYRRGRHVSQTCCSRKHQRPKHSKANTYMIVVHGDLNVPWTTCRR